MTPNYMTDYRDDVDKKIQIVSFLRQSENINRSRIQEAEKLWKSESNDYKMLPDYTFMKEPANEDNDKKHIFYKSVLLRLFLSILLVVSLYYIKKQDNSPLFNGFKKQTAEWIAKDYTKNIFDFMKGIPYTSIYEKTNVK